MRTVLTATEWLHYEHAGYLRLGKLLTDVELHDLQQRIDDIMLGRADVNYDRMLMQLDRIPGETDAPGPQTKGHKGATLRYRKIQDLEFDPLFLAYLQKPLFRHICERVYGATTPIACFRAMFMNKPAHEGTVLVWHQDRWTHLDRDPQITIWTALDPATQANGCVEIVAGTHHHLINPDHGSGFLTDAQAAELLQKNERIYLELAAGEAVLLHNYLPHGSGVNSTDIPRRAFSVCYMDAATKTSNGEQYARIFGEGALSVRQ
ncbi:MAG: phytanoyl-CoA dioxygenase family protein [Caldilineaceae bacterium]